MNFILIKDVYVQGQNKRWLSIAPPNTKDAAILLARADNPEQLEFTGKQTGGRVFLFLNTDNFWRDFNEMIKKGIKFVRLPKDESYRMVAVFKDLYGKLWALLELKPEPPITKRMIE